MKYSTNTY